MDNRSLTIPMCRQWLLRASGAGAFQAMSIQAMSIQAMSIQAMSIQLSQPARPGSYLGRGDEEPRSWERGAGSWEPRSGIVGGWVGAQILKWSDLSLGHYSH